MESLIVPFMTSGWKSSATNSGIQTEQSALGLAQYSHLLCLCAQYKNPHPALGTRGNSGPQGGCSILPAKPRVDGLRIQSRKTLYLQPIPVVGTAITGEKRHVTNVNAGRSNRLTRFEESALPEPRGSFSWVERKHGSLLNLIPINGEGCTKAQSDVSRHADDRSHDRSQVTSTRPRRRATTRGLKRQYFHRR